MERGAITYSAAYLAGICAALVFGMPPYNTIFLTLPLLAISYITRKRCILFLFTAHSAIFMAGACAATLASKGSGLPEGRIAAAVSGKCSEMRSRATVHLASIVPGKEEHATLCALIIGDKGLMERELRQEYSRAGAMHVLALSGLHIGILFAIIYRCLSILCFIPWGNMLRNILAMGIIFGYALFTGASPSVMRASFMIFIYKIAGLSFRQAGKWDAMFLSAMIICIIDPLQIRDIGFQLSYSAVIGIAVIYPTCRTAYKHISLQLPVGKGIVWAAGKIWDSVSISVCCQITTLPLVLYYFGNVPEWFLLANIVAVPAATAILYLAVAAAALHWIPVAGDFAAEALEFTIRLLNASVGYISG